MVYHTYIGSDLHIAKFYTSHNQSNKWVYQATSQAILPVGFIRIKQIVVYT